MLSRCWIFLEERLFLLLISAVPTARSPPPHRKVVGGLFGFASDSLRDSWLGTWAKARFGVNRPGFLLLRKYYSRFMAVLALFRYSRTQSPPTMNILGRPRVNPNVIDAMHARLRCTETMADSPSTSFATSSATAPPRTRIHAAFTFHRSRTVFQPLPNSQQIPVSQLQERRRRPPTPDHALNNPQRSKVYNSRDLKLQLDPRVLSNLMRQEEKLSSNYHYFTAVQDHVTPYHREQAVEWIYDVAKEEHCDGDVFPLAVGLIDRFLSIQNIFKHDIQMLAGVCLFVASKLKAPRPLNAGKISYYSDDSCKVDDVLSWELLVVTQLDYETVAPTAMDFFDIAAARLPLLNDLREQFTHTVHRIQKS
ncbi:unnamed protein product [Caenorhabditis auriculariae]|uniref:Cyclin-like domain-containing protein n=1 Tax=Caenorhabditis auriculariae TaxID=2777116 RepID=A0A8S1HR78_9PELO|nr:unnamed protein product [Caenorhabditis auriculariae]